MDLRQVVSKIKSAISKYKYAIVILLVGVILLLMPQRNKSESKTEQIHEKRIQTFEITELTEILQSIQGAGKVKVLLSVASGEKTIYQIDSDIDINSDSNSTKQETVIVTDAQRAETGLITQVNPPIYLGAIVVCEGADSATVRFAVTQAVAKITGLRSDNICVLKMES